MIEEAKEFMQQQINLDNFIINRHKNDKTDEYKNSIKNIQKEVELKQALLDYIDKLEKGV